MLVWIGADDVPILHADAVFSQLDADLGVHIVTIGQFAPPALVGTPAEQQEQAAEIDFVPVKVIARLPFTPSKLDEVIQTPQANVDQREQAATLRRGDPRDE